MAELLTLIADLTAAGHNPTDLPTACAMRPYRRADAEALGRHCFESYDPGVSWDTPEEAVAYMASFDGAYGELWTEASPVVEHDGILIAALLTERRVPRDGTPDCPFIIELFTDRAFSRRGLARALLTRCPGTLCRCGGTSITLRVDAANGAARALYDPVGFRIEHEPLASDRSAAAGWESGDEAGS